MVKLEANASTSSSDSPSSIFKKMMYMSLVALKRGDGNTEGEAVGGKDCDINCVECVGVGCVECVGVDCEE